jgi:hypothetical protein
MTTFSAGLATLARCALVAAAAAALAGCFEASGGGPAGPPAATMGAPPPGGPNAATMAEPVQPVTGAQASGPMTPTRARESCWMDAETNKKAPSNLDQRAKWVDQCVTAKMSGR